MQKTKDIELTKDISILKRAGGIATGLLIGLSMATPVSAAASMPPQDWPTYVLLGSVAMLAIGVLALSFVWIVFRPPSDPGTRRREPEPNYSFGAFRNQALHGLPREDR